MSGTQKAPLLTSNDLVSLLEPWGGTRSAIHALFEQTALAYASEGRFYHTLSHIGEVLAKINFFLASDDTRLTNDNLLVLKLAGWFHDVVYNPRQNDNEAQSGTWMTDALTHFDLSALILQKTSYLILATRNHIASPDDISAQILLDADLSVLGAPPDIYAQYATTIRQEYAFVPYEAYRAGRQAILEQFLTRPKIFKTTIAYATLENQARINLTEEIRSFSEDIRPPSTPLHQHP